MPDDTAPAPLREQVALAIYRELEGHDPFEKDVSPLGSASGRMATAAALAVATWLDENGPLGVADLVRREVEAAGRSVVHLSHSSRSTERLLSPKESPVDIEASRNHEAALHAAAAPLFEKVHAQFTKGLLTCAEYVESLTEVLIIEQARIDEPVTGRDA